MAVKPVKVLTDLLTKKQIIKQDPDGNILFNVSGTLENGHVSSSLPITASYFVGDGSFLTNISGSGGIPFVYTSGSISGSGLQANPIYLKDPLLIGTVTASVGFQGRLHGTSSYSLTASYAENATVDVSQFPTRAEVTGVLGNYSTLSGVSSSFVTYTQVTSALSSYVTTATFNNFTSSYNTASFSGSFFGTASYATNALTASYALNAASSSFAATASYAQNSSITTTSLQNAYNRLRYQATGNFDITGSAIVVLPSSSLGGNAFPVMSFNDINVTVMIKNEDRWTNDLLSVQLYTSSTNVYVELSAPALTNADQYKLLAVNENPIDYVVI